MPAHKAIQIWLYAVCAMIFVMAVIGAVTRLTESGLSMVEWKPLVGWIPPLDEKDWARVYDLYKQSPEFRERHYWMGLEDFKRIFFWEWLHRLWGRLIGLAYALPLLWFWIRKQIPQGYGLKFLGLLLLGGGQGVLGWWMVKSGLADRPEVSHFRLAAHLGLALVLFGALWWTALGLGPSSSHAAHGPLPLPRGEGRKGLLWYGLIALAFLSITIVWGAFTAGLDAGQIYNSFPLMNGSLTPPESFNSASLTAQQGWVQFAHRWLAVLTGLLIVSFAVRIGSVALGLMALVQIGLGIATLLSQVFIPLAALHQAGAVILLALLLTGLRRFTRKDSGG